MDSINNGTLLGWLIDLETHQVEICRQGKKLEIINNPQILSGGDVLPEFCLNLELIWSKR
jgi:Uma2 family endonuclease